MKTGINSRSGESIEFGDIVETVQGTKFEVISILGQPKLQDKDGYLFDLENYMSPNIWIIGKVEKPQIF
jgi:hypothetical protein